MVAQPEFVGAIPPPPGQTAREKPFNDPDTLWKWSVLCESLCLGIPGIMFIMRVYVRAWIKRLWILEDWLSVLSFIGLVVYCALLTTVIHNKGGTHQWNVTNKDLEHIAYYVNMVQIIYGPAATFIKSTILLLYLRVFSPNRRTALAIGIRIFIAVIVLFYVALTVAKICQCLPREKIWKPKKPGHCVQLPIVLDVSGAFNILSDFAILLVPVKGLWALQMDWRRKLGVYAIFTVGIVGPAFSIIGFVKRFQLVGSKDQSFNQPVILLWATAELATGMMIICLPVLPGLLQARRRSRPSVSILNGSASNIRSRSGRASKFYPQPTHASSNQYSSYDDDNRLVAKGTYLELEEAATQGSLGEQQQQQQRGMGAGLSGLGGWKGKDWERRSRDRDGEGDVRFESTVVGGREVTTAAQGPVSVSAVLDSAVEQRGQILKTVTVEQTRS